MKTLTLLPLLALALGSTALAKQPVVQDLTVLAPANEGTLRAIAEVKVNGATAHTLFETIASVGVAHPNVLTSRSTNTYVGDHESWITNLVSKDGSIRCMKVVETINAPHSVDPADQYQCLVRIQPIKN